MRVRLSSSLTNTYKITPIIIGAFGLFLNIISVNDSANILIPSLILIVGIIVNFVIIDAFVDREYVYVKFFFIEYKFSLDKIDKIGSPKEGITSFSIKKDSFSRTYWIVDIGSKAGRFYVDEDPIDVYNYLLKVKKGYSSNSNTYRS